ncbi:Type I inositol 1,4,5-trisphosphate 5-phosphatase CVP2 [Acorus calamus]|uniref:Type I inositol 1,4,5-trisphosphate 5-phosphatase CVP2 n=1 Tax=Acorus calamus TaxID=4465 RepID=A0AAV9F1H8_ACOCL|nr:Type I inositol 1,4,5-trisphosphate 5-phosphatase CVP2 [Acorus calamus]
MTWRNDRKKSFIPRVFRRPEKKGREENKDSINSPELTVEFESEQAFSATPSPVFRNSFSEAPSVSRLANLRLSSFESPMPNLLDTQPFRTFVATWNVGGNSPHRGLNLDDFLRVDEPSDIYVLGFQEIVPLNAGNVLVIEDNEPAAKWLTLINQSLNKKALDETVSCPSTPSYGTSFSSQASSTKSPSMSRSLRSSGGSRFFAKPSLKAISKNFRTEKGRRLKTCNCPLDLERKNSRDSCFRCPRGYISEEDSSTEEEGEEEEPSSAFVDADTSVNSTSNEKRYSLVASKQMVGIFVTIWVRRELVQHIGHLRISCVGRGIMGCLGNKGCISVSMSLYQTSFCFVCSHLASGEKEGDELRRNSDVIEILKNTQFPKICKTPNRRIPEKILGHDRIIWLGDLNYRIALSYLETRKLLENDDWDALLEKDQLKIEREAGRVFKGWKEGKIYFAPTYKYSNNSDSYSGETVTSKKKRRTPAWCDRILWHGDGITQLSYIRGESRFSDHRPVCAVFMVEVGVFDGRLKKGMSTPSMKVGVEELLPPSTSYYPIETMYSDQYHRSIY